MSDLPLFDNIRAFTNTLVIATNVTFDLLSLYNNIVPKPASVVYERNPVTKRRKLVVTFTEDEVDEGFIILRIGPDIDSDYKGARVDRLKYFKHTLVSIFKVRSLDACVNCKICPNGVIQITGCKDEQCIPVSRAILECILQSKPCLTFTREPYDKVECYTVNVMRNIHFDLGFQIDKERLCHFVEQNTPFFSLQDCLGRSGGNLKLRIDVPYEELPAVRITIPVTLDVCNVVGYGSTVMEDANVGDYLSHLPAKDRRDKLRKKRYNTFMIFSSGKIICCSICRDTARDTYEKYMAFLVANRESIEFKLDDDHL